MRDPGFRYSTVPVPEGHRVSAVMTHTWIMDAARCRTAVEGILPDGAVHLYLNLGPTGRHVVGPEEVRASSSPRPAWVVGPHGGVLHMAKELADSHVVGVRLRPGVVPSILGVPAAALRDQVGDLDAFWGPAVERLRARLSETRDPARRAELVEGEVARHTPHTATRDEALVHALREAMASNPSTPVGRIADGFGLSHRRLIALFDHHVGLKPKEFQRITRLRAALHLVARGSERAGARIAFEVGFADQAHLANEVRRLTGMTLSGYAAARSAVGIGSVARVRVEA